MELGFRCVKLARRGREHAQRKVDVEQTKLAAVSHRPFSLNALTSLDQRMGTALQTWGVDLDSIDSEPVPAGHVGAARWGEVPDDPLRMPAVAMPQGRTAAARSTDGGAATAGSRRAPTTTRSAVAAVRTETGELPHAGESVRAAPELLPSIREFVPVPAIAPAYPENASIVGFRLPLRMEAAARNQPVPQVLPAARISFQTTPGGQYTPSP